MRELRAYQRGVFGDVFQPFGRRADAIEVATETDAVVPPSQVVSQVGLAAELLTAPCLPQPRCAQHDPRRRSHQLFRALPRSLEKS